MFKVLYKLFLLILWSKFTLQVSSDCDIFNFPFPQILVDLSLYISFCWIVREVIEWRALSVYLADTL